MTIPALRPYQITTNEQLHQAVAEGHFRVILCLPTGGGKTTIAASLIYEMVAMGKTVLFMAHRTELVDNAVERLALYGIRPGVIMAGRRGVISPVQVASIQTLGRRNPPHADVVFVDECHHSTSPTWKALIDHYYNQGSTVIGLTATPYRTDGKGLGDLYDHMVCPVTMKDLIGEGFLVPGRFYGPAFDTSKFKISRGDFDSKQVSDKFSQREMYDGLLDNYRRFADGKKGVIFCPSVKVSLEVVKLFSEAGYRIRHVDGETNIVERNESVDALRRGEIDLLTNVNILTEGVDIPSIEVAILYRSTISKSLYFQMVGRVLRPYGTKRHAIIIDQGGNFRTFGDPADDPIPTLHQTQEKKKKTIGASPVKECPSCGLLQHLSAQSCIECGHVFNTPKKLKKAEFVDMTELLAMKEASGELAEVLKKPWDTLSMQELEMVRVSKGYKNGWLLRQLHAQAAEMPEIKDTIFRQLVSTYGSLKGYGPGWVDHQIKLFA